MEINDISQLILKGENQTCEFKANFNADTIETLVAFANSKGGNVLIGISDKGKIVGTKTNNESVQNWINEIKSKTTPQLIAEADTVVIDNKTIVLLFMPEYPIKPVAVRGKYFKRVGNSNHLMTISEVVNLHLSAFNTSWDFYLNNRFTIEDISLDKVQNAIDKFNKRGRNIDDDPMTFLYKNNLLREGKITNAALLLFSVRDTVFSTIEMGRFQTEIIIKDSSRSKSDVITQLDQTTDFITKHINKEIIISGNPQNTERWQYPIEAVREIVANMIVHRDYSLSSDSIIKIFDDRIAFFNPGGLPHNVTVEDLLSFKYKSNPRNKLIADFFKDLGIIEKYGSGIKRIVTYCQNYGLPAPKFDNLSDGFEVTLFTHKTSNVTDDVTDDVTGDVTDRRLQLIINSILSNNKLSTAQLAKLLHVSKRTILRDIEKLKKNGKLIRIGSEKGGHWEVID